MASTYSIRPNPTAANCRSCGCSRASGRRPCSSSILIAADSQKSHFRANPANKDEFIRTGLWAWSRHPNYFGEIALWIGITVAALPALSGWQYVTLISPIFVLILIGRVSGVPLLEAKADRKWGGREDYEQYKASTPVLVPRPPRSRP